MATINDKRSTVIGVFEDRDHAVAAIRDLYNAGFPEDRIGIARRGADGDMVAAGTTSQQAAPAKRGLVPPREPSPGRLRGHRWAAWSGWESWRE